MKKNNKMVKTIRWIARIISSLASLYFVLTILGEALFNNLEPVTLEGILVAGFTFFLAIAVIISWIKEKTGGIILIIGALAFAIFIYISAGTHKLLASVLISSPFLISGILFYLLSFKK